MRTGDTIHEQLVDVFLARGSEHSRNEIDAIFEEELDADPLASIFARAEDMKCKSDPQPEQETYCVMESKRRRDRSKKAQEVRICSDLIFMAMLSWDDEMED